MVQRVSTACPTFQLPGSLPASFSNRASLCCPGWPGTQRGHPSLPSECWDFKAVYHHTQLQPPSMDNLGPLVETLSPGDPSLPVYLRSKSTASPILPTQLSLPFPFMLRGKETTVVAGWGEPGIPASILRPHWLLTLLERAEGSDQLRAGEIKVGQESLIFK